ncbi:type I-MYXAN CRISPR-associated Cas8a1/Cmx1 [Ferroacidibacillus organovorans]|uniref:Type I-MYXAN CRISPR-associated Cas8a1/Cmx1 n=1 Tax=Ferroacidibacillus organovorans TaxID=1765683 RepID=A0A1V4EXK0_9BACL|nr:type I-MYXAN CRISPR-associated Cas8a1/Cmx1 [Ferroacidibacillus organovorans]OPG17665.1 hypothetical protein B2M26_00495 [Ferroacidibacillus organovorans]
MDDCEWSFDLNAPGMTPLHRAGLIGLSASCRTSRMKDWMERNGLSSTTDGDTLLLSGLPNEAEFVHRFLSALYDVDDAGLIHFPLHEKLREVDRAEIQNVMMASFLQHPKSRNAASAWTIRPKSEDNDREYRFKALYDFNHRSLKTAEEVVSARKGKRAIELAGWAMPGAIVKHVAHSSATALTDTPERYLLLMLSMLGCLWYRAQAYTASGEWDPRAEVVLVLPYATRLEVESRKLHRYYTGGSMAVSRIGLVCGIADAALSSAVALETDEDAFTINPRLHTVCFGKVPWSSQQKTRTRVLIAAEPSEQATRRYRSVIGELANRPATRLDGSSFIWVMPMRETIAENVLKERPWYIGFSQYARGRNAVMISRWREGLRNLVNDDELWADQDKRKFVELMHVAMFKRYGQVAGRALDANADLRRAFQRERERLVLDFVNCRTQDMLRQNLLRLMAQTAPRFSGGVDHAERDVLMKFAFNWSDWREVRDLCLLALATYRGKGDEDVADALDPDPVFESLSGAPK